ncbi:MAG TPA: 50S ribosomal protein L4 [Armatimonadota bacterium]|jgi:large subunit ribosomal protein L4
MPQAAVLNMRGEEVAQIELDAKLFDVELNMDLLHQAVLYIDNNKAQLRGCTLTRSQISRTGAKMYRQKGLGRARHGDRGAPTFVGGGKAMGPGRERHRLRMPRKMRRRALACALTAQLRKGLIRFVDELRPEEVSTKLMITALENLRCSRGKILALVGPEEYYDEVVDKSSRNVPRFILRLAPHVNVRDLLVADHIIMTQGALAQMKTLVGGAADVE